jgi:hypothetical protein
MMWFLIAALGAAQPQVPPAAPTASTASASLNPRAIDLFERDPVLNAWALRTFDRNGDGWLTLYEAQPAVGAFKEMADTDRDGRVTVQEFKDAKAYVAARVGSAGQ